MALRFFVDHCVPRSVGTSLRAAGYDVLLLRDHLRVDADDDVVIQAAQQLNAILLSMNGDFADIVRYPPANFRGLIGLQVRNHPELIGPIVARLLAYLANQADPNDYVGRLLIVEPHRIRIRT